MKTLSTWTCILLALACVWGLGSAPAGSLAASDLGPDSKDLPLVETFTLTRASISSRLRLTGSLVPERIASLASLAEGPVDKVLVRPGDWVKAGEALVSIGGQEGQQALVASLRQEVKAKRLNLSRTRELVENQALAGERLEQAELDLSRAQAELAQAEEASQGHELTAPFAAMVCEVQVVQGEVVGPRQELLTVYDPASLVVETLVPERYLAQVGPGTRVEVRLDAYPKRVLQTKIDRLDPCLDPQTRAQRAEIGLDQDQTFLPGMFARIEVLLHSAEQALVIPDRALVSGAKGQAVYVLKGGKAVRRSVKTGIKAQGQVQVTKGLESGDQVIVSGHKGLKDGVQVQVTKASDSNGSGLGSLTRPQATSSGVGQ
jgi:membrane fusion protein (multidrug efflux system)